MRPVNLSLVIEFVFTSDCLQAAEKFLRDHGRREREGLVLLSGSPLNDQRVLIDQAHFPAQVASAVHVQILPGAMLEIHHELLGQERLLVGQIHTHPGEAFHSTIDREDTTLTQPGTFSIVAPDFAANGLKTWPGCAVYRRLTDGWSRALAPAAIRELLTEE